MSGYLYGILVSVSSALLYIWFRSDVFDGLVARGIRKREIRRRMKGAWQFWFYRELEIEYGLGVYGKLVCLYVPVWGIVTVFHILLGWFSAVTVIDTILLGGLSFFASAMIFYTRTRLNRRIIGSPFLLLGWKKNVNRKGQHLYTDYYSTVLDLFLAAFPMVYILLI
jgi:hypothetical protein